VSTCDFYLGTLT